MREKEGSGSGKLATLCQDGIINILFDVKTGEYNVKSTEKQCQ